MNSIIDPKRSKVGVWSRYALSLYTVEELKYAQKEHPDKLLMAIDGTIHKAKDIDSYDHRFDRTAYGVLVDRTSCRYKPKYPLATHC